MISVERYRQITGDLDSNDPEVERCVTDAVELLQEYLGRELAEAERTEAMRPDRQGRLWPKVTPILIATGYTIDGLALVGSSPFSPAVDFIDPTSSIEVTYTGGWVDQSVDGYDTAATNQPPGCIVRDLALAAHRLAHPAVVSSDFPEGATSVRLGDAAVTFGPSGAGAVTSTDSWWSRRTRGYRYAPIHTQAVTV